MGDVIESWSEFWGYDPRPIEPERGVSIRMFPNGGGRVVMYHAMPGLYLNGRGREVPDEEARRAGFDIAVDRRRAQRDRQIQAARERIEREAAEAERAILEAEEPDVREGLRQTGYRARQSFPPMQPEAPRPEDVEVTETNQAGVPRGTRDFFLDHRGGGRFEVVDRNTKEPWVTPEGEESWKADSAVEMLLHAQKMRDKERAAGGLSES